MSGVALDFRVLGPTEVTADGLPVPLGGSRPLIVLAGLLLRANKVVSVEELGRWLWPDDQRRSKGALQTYILRVRRALGDEVALRTERGGYLLELDESLLDLARFRALAAAGAQAAGDGDPRQAADRFAAALSEWRGPALQNVHSEALLRDEADQLSEERLRVREQWADALIALGDHATVIPQLTRLCRENPLRERLHEQLMLALYRSGRQAEALAVYRRIGAVLAEELGLDPGASLQRAHQAILTGEESVETTLDSELTRYRLGTEPLIPRQLPADLRVFSGRQRDLKALHGLVPEALDTERSTSIASIEGMGGIGKTTLAVHFAHEVGERFPGGQVYLNLRGYGPGEPVETATALETMLVSVGVPADRIPADVDGRAATWRSHSAGRRMLILLDNAASTEQIRPLLPGPGCLVLVTSRWQLQALVATHGARRVALEELPEEDAIALVASTIGLDRVTEDPEATERFVRYCGGLPLAIRILAVRAAQFPDLPLREFVRLLEAEQDRLDSFDLADGDETNIRAVFSYSYRALDERAARMLRLLGLPTGGDFSVPAAAAVAGVDIAEAHADLAKLASAHLIARSRPGRYQFHDLIRAYAAELSAKVDGPEARSGVLDRLLHASLASALNASRLLRSDRHYRLVEPERFDGAGLKFGHYEQALDWFDEEAGNLIAAVNIAYREQRHRECWQLAWLLQSYFIVRARLEDWRSVFGVALRAARDLGDRSGEAAILSGLGVACGVARQYEDSIVYLKQVVELQRQVGDRQGEARALYNLTLASQDPDTGWEYGTRALRLIRESNVGAGMEASALQALGDICTQAGRFEQALDFADQALALEAHALPDEARFTLHTKGTALVGLGRHDEGIACMKRAVEMFFAHGELYEAADVLAQLGGIHLRFGDPSSARDCWLRSVRVLTELAHPDAEDVRTKLASLVGETVKPIRLE
ncbi:transcriptional regulator, SARP family protein [Amycolatopsis thailandensis]|uniref:Transcriptional regulator, SARP family protein n=1 Tax=Amycolatopsis thailandensis TaxID=589330 RepID=A0A229RGW1_9PSEU|nr:BTAD domain-containing putative transcriptional regulator [Amycolatopsis thailandensis]OXM45902.1 transcriptional regulator, SARP family protein [Amycolatopsis thailandensis]